MATTYATDTYAGDGTETEFDLTFQLISRDHLEVVVLDDADGAETALTVIETGSPVGNEYRWENDTHIKVGTAPTEQQKIRLRRKTPENQQLVQWRDGSYIIAEDLNTSEEQSLYLDQELDDRLTSLEILAFKYFGFIDVTTDKAPANPTNGTFYVNTGTGNVRNSWTGIVGDPVVGAEQVVFNSTTAKWEIFQTPSSQSGVNAIASDGPITVDGSTPSVPIIGIETATPSSKGALSPGDKTKLDLMSPDYTYPGGVKQTVQNRLEQFVSVKDFGAVGDGVTDDSPAFRAAFAASQSVYVPAGNYYFDGAPITTIKQVNTPQSATDTAFHLYGDGSPNSRIKMAPGRTFLEYGAIRACHVHDLAFFNFEHCFKFTNTSVNVANRKMWEYCIFEGYTGCAISQQQEDSPYWSVENCTFKADINSNTSIGVALGNNPNLSSIRDNIFIRNRIHLKLGGGGVDVLVEHNDFLQFSKSGADPRVAIFIYTDQYQRNPDGSYTLRGRVDANGNPVIDPATGLQYMDKIVLRGDGAGLNVFSNKFGNENKRADDKFIVYADQQLGTFNGDKFPELTQDAVETKEFHQSQFINNKIQGGGSGGAGATPFIFSTTRFLTDFIVNENNLKSALQLNYWVEFLNPSTALTSYSHRWFFGVFGGDDVQQTGVSPQFSNEILNLEVFSADTGTEIWTQKHSPNPLLGINRVGYYMVSDTAVRSFTTGGGASKTADISDGTGGENAATFNLASGLVYPAIFTGSMPGGVNNDGSAGDPLWLHFDLKKSASNPIGTVSVALRKNQSGARQWARFIRVPENWVTFRFPVFIRDSSSTMLLEFKKGGGGGSLDIGRYSLYSSKDCVPQGQVTFDSVKSDTMTMSSPDGTEYNVTVANGGTLTVTAV